MGKDAYPTVLEQKGENLKNDIEPYFCIKNHNTSVISYMAIMAGLFAMVLQFLKNKFNYYLFFIGSGFFIAGIFLVFKKKNVYFYDDKICTDDINMIWNYTSVESSKTNTNLSFDEIKNARVFEYFMFDDMKVHKRTKITDILYFVCYLVVMPFYCILFCFGLIKNVKFKTLLLTNHDNTKYIALPLNLMSDSEREMVEKFIDKKIGFENIKQEKFYLGINHK